MRSVPIPLVLVAILCDWIIGNDLDLKPFRRKQPLELGVELPLIDVLNWEGCGLRRGLRLGELRRRCGWSRSVQENGRD